MISRKLVADLALVCAVFLATAGIVEAQRTYNSYLDPAFMDFQLRSQTLATRIEDGIKSGSLKTDAGATLMSQLKSINTTPEDGKFNGQFNARLHAQLDKLSSSIDLQMADRKTKSSAIKDIVAKKARIEAELSSTPLSPIQSVVLQKKLSRISAFELDLLSNHGGLSYWQRRKIMADLDLLESQISASRRELSARSSSM